MALENPKVEEHVAAFIRLVKTAQPTQVDEIHSALTRIPSERCAKLFALEPQLGSKFVELLRQAWPKAGERLRYQISLATEAVMDVLTNEQAERFGLPAVLVFIAGCGRACRRESPNRWAPPRSRMVHLAGGQLHGLKPGVFGGQLLIGDATL